MSPTSTYSGHAGPPCHAFPGGVFYVFVHGLIAMHRCDNYIDLIIPNVGPSHSYRYGEFLGEVTLPPSPAPYHITGIEGGDPRPDGRVFDPAEHLVTNGLKTLNAEADIYARIRLPLPKVVHSYLKVNLADVIHDPLQQFDSSGGTVGTLTPVLEYAFQDPRDILFAGQPLNVAPLEYQSRWYINLHVFAEEDVERDDDHTIAGFDKLTSLFDFDAPPTLLAVTNIPQPSRGSLPPGTVPLEFLTLGLRTRELGYLGRLVRDEALDGCPVFVRVSAVDGDVASCLSCANDGN